MAVQKSRVTRSKRGMRRAHDSLAVKAVSVDQLTGEAHLRHHVTPEGYYRGKQVLATKKKKISAEQLAQMESSMQQVSDSPKLELPPVEEGESQNQGGENQG